MSAEALSREQCDYLLRQVNAEIARREAAEARAERLIVALALFAEEYGLDPTTGPSRDGTKAAWRNALTVLSADDEVTS